MLLSTCTESAEMTNKNKLYCIAGKFAMAGIIFSGLPRISASKNIGGFINLAVVGVNRQTAKLNSPPNFPDIRY